LGQLLLVPWRKRTLNNGKKDRPAGKAKKELVMLVPQQAGHFASKNQPIWLKRLNYRKNLAFRLFLLYISDIFQGADIENTTIHSLLLYCRHLPTQATPKE
jgi:hypothetical protein